MENRTTERLAELIRRKHQVLVQLRDVGHRQTSLIACGQTSSLLKLLAAKQHLISALQGLERELTPYHAEEPESRSWRSPEDRAQCARQAAECNVLLAEVVELEKSGADAMTARRNEVAEQLQQVHSAAHVRSAYQAQRRNYA
jgi:flagellar biosynthesis/type III secretory pathway chaperone